jgi:adenylosuccinate synthase
MPVTIVVGGQYGSEGKGKIAALVGASLRNPWHVRCGGPNSGHTVTVGGKNIVLRQVPSSTSHGEGTFCLAAGCAINIEILIQELETVGIDRERIIVDPRAVIVTNADREIEAGQLANIGSTCSGTGAAMIRRVSRSPECFLAKDSDLLQQRCRVETVAPMLHKHVNENGNVVVEGSQGFGLSLLHGPDYPFVTSRDTTAAGFAMEVGLSPRAIDKIVMVVRTFPIRVGGPSGPFAGETSWEEVARISSAPSVVPEYTSVTQRLRRVAHFDLRAVQLACAYNRPTSLAVMGIDRLDYRNSGIGELRDLTPDARVFLRNLEAATGVPIEFVGTGFGTFDVVSIERGALRDEFCHA